MSRQSDSCHTWDMVVSSVYSALSVGSSVIGSVYSLYHVTGDGVGGGFLPHEHIFTGRARTLVANYNIYVETSESAKEKASSYI